MIKRLAILFLLAFASTFCFGQANMVATKVLNVSKSVYLSGHRVDSISTDTTLSSNSDNIIPSQKAVRIQVGNIGYLNVQRFTGIPNGSDNAAAIETAVNQAIATGRTLYFPAGTYTCNVQDVYGHIITPTYSGGSLKMVFDKGAVITTNSKTLTLIFFNGPFINVDIEGGQFVSTHDTTNVGNGAIVFQGISPALIKHVRIHGCTFTGFSNTIVGKGVHDLHIWDNTFLAPLGHDNATTTTVPAVFIKAVDDSVGDSNKSWDVHDNYFDGFSGGGRITQLKTGGPMDGAFFGHVSGLQLHDNSTRRFAQEQLLYQPGAYIDSIATAIYNNNLDCAIPDSSKTPTGSAIQSNYGIRAEGQKIKITGNTISNATVGILFYGTGDSSNVWYSPEISHNTIWMTKDTTMLPTKGILLQGYGASTPSIGGSISDNTVVADSTHLGLDFYFFTVNFFNNVYVSGNSTLGNAMILNGHNSYGLSMQNSTLQLGANNFTAGATPIRVSNSTTTNTISNLTSGIWTPTVTNELNVSSPSGQPCMYTRIDSIISFSGCIQLTVTAANTASGFDISLPPNLPTPTFVGATNAAGSISASKGLGNGGNTLNANTGTTNTITINFESGASTGTYVIYFSGHYVIP